jgi:cyclopropane fatty-acyl-phospholipid synthase-like methyltransferase
MRPAEHPHRDYRALVRDGYDRIAAAYNDSRGTAATASLDLLDDLPAGSRVLDLGCGAGVPVARRLALRHRVVGVDLSRSMLSLARTQAPGVELILGDMDSIAFAPASFDAVVSFYAIFHLPRERQPALFARMHRWLRPGGALLVSTARTDEAAYTEEFFGVEMYWSHYGRDAYRLMIADTGFTIADERTLPHGYDDDGAPKERHPLFFARKP